MLQCAMADLQAHARTTSLRQGTGTCLALSDTMRLRPVPQAAGAAASAALPALAGRPASCQAAECVGLQPASGNEGSLSLDAQEY